MTRAITLIPSTGECEDLTYCERVSRDRGLHVLLQDCSAATNFDIVTVSAKTKN